MGQLLGPGLNARFAMYDTMKKEELIAELLKRDAELATLKSAKELGRKAQVMNLIAERGRVTIAEIAEATGMTARNVSTQLTYLRADGNCFGKDSKGRLYIEAADDK